MRPSLRSSLAKVCLTTVLTIIAIALLAGSASAQFVAPDHVNISLNGCNNDGTIKLPISGKFVCPDADYTSGNLGKGWNELDLVPHRLITQRGSNSTTASYNVIVAADYSLNSDLGYDVIFSDVGSAGPGINESHAGDASCSATWTTSAIGPGITGGADSTIYRVLTITQAVSTTCYIDYYERLALGAAQYPGSSLQSYKFESSDFKTGKATIPLPVNQIQPQSLSKTMTAKQDMTIPWSVTKSATPTSVSLKDTCDPNSPNSSPVAITITWKKLASTPTGGVSIETIVSATNPSARTITVNVFDQIYGGASGTTNLIDRFPASGTLSVDVPANTTMPVLTHDFIDNSGLYTGYNDVATATYTDKVTGVAVPGSTTATASVSSIQAGSLLNSTATVHDDESITGTGTSFSITSTSPAQPYGTFSCTLNSATTSCGWDSPALSGNGSVTFNKTISVPANAVTSGDLKDQASLLGSDGFVTDSNKIDITISADALVSLDLIKNVSGLTSGSQAFNFHVSGTTGSNAKEVASPSLTFNAGDTQKTASITGLLPDKYNVTEDTVTGWVTDPGQSTTITLPSCSGSVTLNNSQEGTIIVKKKTSPAGGTGFTFTGDAAGSIDDGGTITVNNLPAGTYASTESAKTGWDLTDVSCDSADGTGSVANSKASFNLHAGETITCTFTNTQEGTIVVKKKTVPAGGTGFTFTGDAANTIDDGGNITVSNLKPGSYSSAETAKTGWNLTDVSCDNVDGTGSVANAKASFNLHAGETITCTFTNTQQGTIVVKKKTVPAGGTGFTFTGDAANTINDGGNITVSNLKPGTYSSTETAKTGWDLTDVSCDSADGTGSVATANASFNLHAGETITCTFTNTQEGTIVVKKKTVPAGGTGFTFTGDAANTIDDGGTITVNNLKPGSYSSSETAKTGWDLTDITCDKADGTGSLAIAKASFNLHAGETITCTFTNTQEGTIVVKKKTVPAGGTGFTFTGDAANTINDGGNITVNNLKPGSYSSTETTKTGWDLTDITCSNADGTGSLATAKASFNLHAGETITCTFTNTQEGTIVVKKKTVPAGGTGFTFTGDAANTIDDGGTITVNNLKPGSYGSTESAKTGWDLTDVSCSNVDGTGSVSTSKASFNLHAGETITCTFTNTQRGKAKVIKTFNGSAALGSNSFTFQLRSGASPSAAGTILESGTATGNTNTISFTTLLVPGTTYQLCEQMQPGWLTTLGPPLYSVYNPSGDNSVVCTDFTVTAGQTVTFTINNMPPPGGMGLTIGFWKNWSSCTGGGQKPTLDKTLFAAESLTPPGISIGIANLYPNGSPTKAAFCAEAVDILNKSTIKGSKQSSNPFYNLAAQLLGAKLNLVAGAGANACVLSDVNSAQNLLVAVKFDDVKVPTGTTLQQNDANYFQTQLNNYNNNLPVTCTITYP